MVGERVVICPSSLEITRRGVPVVGIARDDTGSITIVSWKGLPVDECIAGRVSIYKNKIELVLEE